MPVKVRGSENGQKGYGKRMPACGQTGGILFLFIRTVNQVSIADTQYL